MSLFGKNNATLGLDIGFETLKLVELKKSGHDASLIGASDFPLPERILENDHFKDKQAAAKLISEACTKAQPHPIRARKIVSALPETFVFSKTIRMPKMEDKDYIQAVPLEAAQYLPIPIDNVYIDFEKLIVHPNEPFIDMLIVASPKRLVDEYVEVAAMAGMELIALETKPLAVGRALIAQNSTEGVIIAEIGTEVTRISIWDANKIRLTATVAIGRNQIAKSLGIESSASTDQEENKPALEQAVMPIIEEVVEGMRYHQNRDVAAQAAKRILLCGSGASFAGLAAIFTEKTKIPTVLAKPKLKAGEIDTRFVTAYGLALREEYE